MSYRYITRVVAMITAYAASAAAGDIYPQEQTLWKPVADEVYLQEIGSQAPSDSPITSVAVYNGAVYCLRDGAIAILQNLSFMPAPGAPQGVTRLESIDGALWAYSPSGLHRFDGNAWSLADAQEFVDLCMHLGSLHGATKEDIYRYDGSKFVSLKPAEGYQSSDVTVMMEDGTQIHAEPVRLGPVTHIDSYAGTLYALRPNALILFDGSMVDERTIDYGTLPSSVTRDLLSLGSRLYIATDHGIGLYRGMFVTILDGSKGLPYEDTTCLAKGFDDDVWVGTTHGAVRISGEDFHYFNADHWLPGEHVHAIAVDGTTVYVATDKGIGVIQYEPYTLAKKADYYEQQLEAWGMKRLGFIHRVYWNDATKSWIREISDNDGGHTAPYLAAMSFKYAVTGDKSARENALDSFQAMIWMEEITGIPGFISRAIWSTTGDEDNKATQGSGGLPAKWYPTDDGLWYWKGDTSSDEVNAHMYGVSIFHDLAAKGPEVERAAQHIARISTHIIDNGFLLRDKDGKPTRWGRWDPNYLLRPYGYVARGLNGMEVQTYMRAAYALTGDKKFEDAYQQLLDLGYHRYTVRQRITFPPDDIAPWDDSLAFECYYTLLRYTTDPRLRSIYLRSVERSYEIKRPEHVAWYNFIYGAITGNDCDLENAVQYLREYPMDLRNHAYRNSHRSDVARLRSIEPYVAGEKALSPRETEAKRGHRWVMPLDGGGRGTSVCEPAAWLQDYWMGRYHGFIEAPKTKDPDLISVKPFTGDPIGAKPYSGPGRPEGLVPRT